MKRKFYSITAFILAVSCLLSLAAFMRPAKVSAAEDVIKVGDETMSYDIPALKKAGYKFTDDRDSSISKTWPYDLDGAKIAASKAYGGTALWQLGQVGGTVTYNFTGTYLAVAFLETYWAAEIIVTIDGTAYNAETPFSADAPKENASDTSIIVFVKDDLSDGAHTVVISHKAGHLSGDDNIKGDGNAYYDNDAMLDCFITKPSFKTPAVGDNTALFDGEIMGRNGYIFVDNTDSHLVYGWPYNLESATQACPQAYGGSICWQLGQVSGTVTYKFSGTYLAIAYLETYWAAEIIVTIDGTSYNAVTPFNASAPKENPAGSVSKIVFIKDDLSDGEHEVVISHAAGHNSGDDNVKGDGNAYYDNDAMFDCLITKASFKVPEAGDLTAGYSNPLFEANGYAIIDNTDAGLEYGWPYNLESATQACPQAYGGSICWQLGQVGGTVKYNFKGTFLAIAYLETYWAAEIIVTIDGTEYKAATPFSASAPKENPAGSVSKIVFVKDDLSDGDHEVVISHAAGHTSGEDNIKADGNAYYDNDAMFDCLIVKPVADPEPTSEPTTEPTTEPTQEPTSTDAPSENPTQAPSKTEAPVNPKTGEESGMIYVLTVLTLCVIISAFIAIKASQKKEEIN